MLASNPASILNRNPTKTGISPIQLSKEML